MSDKVVTNTNPVLPRKVEQPHDAKMLLLLIVTILLGFLTILSLVFMLKAKNTAENPSQVDNSVVEITENQDKVVEDTTNDDELGRKKLISELDNFKLENILENYSDEVLEENL